VGCHFLLQGIFLTQGSKLSFLYWQADSLPLNHLGSPQSWEFCSFRAGLLPHFFNSLSPDLVLPDFSKQGPLCCPLKKKPTHLQRGSPEVPECCHPD